MATAEITRRVIEYLYDAQVGRYRRRVRPMAFYNLAVVNATGASAGTVLASSATTTNANTFITYFIAGSPNSGHVSLVAGTSTITSVYINSGVGSPGQVGPFSYPDALTRVGSATTISVITSAAGTFSASVSGYEEPTFANLET